MTGSESLATILAPYGQLVAYRRVTADVADQRYAVAVLVHGGPAWMAGTVDASTEAVSLERQTGRFDRRTVTGALESIQADRAVVR